MAQEQTGLVLSFEAGSTSLVQYQFVIASATGNYRVVTPTTGARVLGVLVNDPTLVGQEASVQVSGIAKVKGLSSTKSRGDWVHATAGGLIATAAPTTNDYVCGQIVAGTSGGSTRIMSVLLKDWGWVQP